VLAAVESRECTQDASVLASDPPNPCGDTLPTLCCGVGADLGGRRRRLIDASGDDQTDERSVADIRRISVFCQCHAYVIAGVRKPPERRTLPTLRTLTSPYSDIRYGSRISTGGFDVVAHGGHHAG
jgi:hypothetical protein